jgi:hypothetical protein
MVMIIEMAITIYTWLSIVKNSKAGIRPQQKTGFNKSILGDNKMFETLNKLCAEEINTRYNERIEEIKTEEGLKRVSQWYGKTYKNNPVQKLTKFLEGRKTEEFIDLDNKLAAIENAPDFSGDFVITIEWIKSATWGHNPKVYTNTRFEYKGISGCGYDKQSTATAYALNSNLSILKLLYQKKEDEINKINGSIDCDFKNDFNRKVLGYGSGYAILPQFEGGVGVSSHESILNSVGLVMNHVSNTSTVDVFVIHF